MTIQFSCYIFDIDGTLADNSHRTHHLLKKPKDWDSYHAATASDGPHTHVVELANQLSSFAPIVFCTGRHDGLRDITQNWLFDNGLCEQPHWVRLYMRKEGDHRPDHVIKLELLAQIRADGFNPIMAFDDRNSVVKMWRDAGVPCAQVAEGDF
jgi:phosphoglycolate phosphatase-like HAD superfamily hydrolase